MRDEAQPLSDAAPSASPFLPTSPLPLTEHPLGARHFTHTLLAYFTTNPRDRDSPLSSCSLVKRCVHGPKVTPAHQGHTQALTLTTVAYQLLAGLIHPQQVRVGWGSGY